MPVEWLPFNLPRQFEIGDSKPLGVISDSVELSRSVDLRLRLSAHGEEAPSNGDKSIPGTEHKGLTFQLTEHSGVVSGFQRRLLKTKPEGNRIIADVNGSIHDLRLSFRVGVSDSIVEWLENTPERTWPRSTTRKIVTSTTRLRTEPTLQSEHTASSIDKDHIEIELNLPTLTKITLGRVDQRFVTEGVKIDNPGFIQYHGGADGLPKEGLRNSVRRAFEFIFGCGFGILGHSELDEQGHQLNATYNTAYIPGGKGAILPPALLHKRYEDGLDESIISPIINRYLQLADLCHLNHAVWLYLHSRNAPLEMAAGYVGAAFEVIRRGFYSLPENEARGQLFTTDRWRLLAARLKTFFSNLSQEDDWRDESDKLEGFRSRLVDLNKLSGRKLNLRFLQDLGLQHGATEMRGLQARNNDAHAVPLDPNASFERLRSYRAAHTLFARALLSMLGASVHYFDYSARNFPLRLIVQRQGDPIEGKHE